MTEPWILGVAYSHNGAACLVRGGELVVAIQEERLCGQKRARIEHYTDSLAVRYCLAHAGIAIDDVELVVACCFAAREPAVRNPRYLTIPHHLGHAYAVFATSGLDAAAVLVVDGQGSALAELPAGERAQIKRGAVPGSVVASEVISVYRADAAGIALLEKHTGDWIPSVRRMANAAIRPPRSLQPFGSLGGMYAAASGLIFDDWMEAGKVMGLAPYGRAVHPASDFYSIDDAGCFHYSDRLCAQFVDLAPWPQHGERFADLAASVQTALERAVSYLARRALAISGSRKLCYAGGVALNSVANERLCAELGGGNVFVMPAAEDSGTAIGAAYYGLAILGGAHAPRPRRAFDSLGHDYAPGEVRDAIARTPYLEVAPAADALETAVELLCDGQILGWFEGGSELGPRALGQRSILCDPRRADGKAVLNERVKHREGFRPFAPAILRDEMARWFEVSPDGIDGIDSPYMLRVCKFREDVRARVPAVVHVDGTGRVQTLTADNGRLYQLVERFFRRTGVPLLLNTSFNIAGEPIVETPDDALWCLLGSGLDAVVFAGAVVRKQAAYRSLLQLHPRVRGRELRMAMPIVDGAVDASLRADTAVAIATDTPYGALTARVRTSDLAILARCDGTRDGWAILDELGRATAEPLDEAYAARRLYHLRRCRVLELRDAPR